MSPQEPSTETECPNVIQEHMRDPPMVGLMGAIFFVLADETLYLRVVAEDTRLKI